VTNDDRCPRGRLGGGPGQGRGRRSRGTRFRRALDVRQDGVYLPSRGGAAHWPISIAGRFLLAEFIYTMRKARKAHGDKVILDDVTLSFLPGAKIGVVGPNGAGKSTVLQIMAGMQQPSNGDVMLAPDATVGILLQEPPLNDELDVRGNVEEGVKPVRDLLRRFDEVNARFGEIEQRGVALTAKGRELYDRLLGESRRRTPGLSSDEHQRVRLGRRLGT
jgi:ATPase subunit of ABC transporter with duplicated ATPase domains